MREATPLTSTVPVASERLEDAALARFAAAAGDASVVGLGEASHGTHEDFLFKTRAFQYLVLHHGLTIFAIEGTWAEWLPMDDFINGGPGDAANLLRHQDFSIFRIKELMPLLEWMRGYNARHPGSLHVVGVDAQEPELTLGIAKRFAQTNEPSALADLDAASGCYLYAAQDGSVKVTQKQADDCLDSLKAASAKMAAGSPATAEQTRALAAIGFLERSTQMSVHHAAWSIGRMNARDATMAANVEYFVRDAYPGAKAVVSAEDMHVATDDATNPSWVTMGANLRAALGKGYYATDLLFHSGAIMVKTKEGLHVKPQSVAVIDSVGDEIGSLFVQVHYPFFLDLQATDAASPLGEWQHREHTQWTFGGVVDPDDVYNSGASHVVLDRSFDGLFFIPVSTPTTPL